MRNYSLLLVSKNTLFYLASKYRLRDIKNRLCELVFFAETNQVKEFSLSLYSPAAQTKVWTEISQRFHFQTIRCYRFFFELLQFFFSFFFFVFFSLVIVSITCVSLRFIYFIIFYSLHNTFQDYRFCVPITGSGTYYYCVMYYSETFTPQQYRVSVTKFS